MRDSAWEFVQDRHTLQETCTSIWNKVHPLVMSVFRGQRGWKEAIVSYTKDNVGANAGQKAAKGGILRFIFMVNISVQVSSVRTNASQIN